MVFSILIIHLIFIILIIKRFPAHDAHTWYVQDKSCPVSPEQPVCNSYAENINVRFCPHIEQVHTHDSKQRHVLADTAPNGTAHAAATPQPGHSFGCVL